MARGVEQVFEARYQALRAKRPQPPYTGDSVAASMAHIMPVAKRVLTLPVGTRLRHAVSAMAGTEHEITQADHDAARAIVGQYERVKQFRANVLPASLAKTISDAYARLALTGAYLEGAGWMNIVGAELERAGEAVRESVASLPATLFRAIPWWAWLLGGLVALSYFRGGKR